MTFLALLFMIFSLQTMEDSGNFYLIFENSSENPTFSSYRLSNPERIVFEASGTFKESDFPVLPSIVKSVEKSESNGMTRFVFFVEPGSQYTFFNRKGTIIMGFSRSVFLDDDNYDTIMAKFTAKKEAERIAQAENARKAEEERLAEEERRTAEEKRIAELQKAEEERRLADEKRIAELKKADEEKRLVAEKESELVKSLMNELIEEERAVEEERLAELKKEYEEKRVAEEKRAAELRKADEEKRLAELQKAEEEKRIAEEKRLAELQKAEKEKRDAERVKAVRSEDGEIRQLKVTKAEKEPTLSEKLPELPVTKLEKKGKLKNIFFRKFPEFSRVTMELDGEVDYQFREISGGFVIDVHNFDKIPKYLLNIIDARAFKAEVAYIYPKKADNILKIYIKTSNGMAVRKSVDDKYVNFDFFKPSIE